MLTACRYRHSRILNVSPREDQLAKDENSFLMMLRLFRAIAPPAPRYRSACAALLLLSLHGSHHVCLRDETVAVSV